MGTKFYIGTHLTAQVSGTSALLLALLNLLPFFFFPDKSSPLPPKYSLEQETRDSQVDVPAVKLWILSCYF